MISLQSAMRLGAHKGVIPWKFEQKPIEVAPVMIEPPAPEPEPPPRPVFPPPAVWGEEDPPEPKYIMLSMIKNAVCEEYAVTDMDIMSSRRGREWSIPRQVICYLAKCHTLRSFQEIGRYLKRDHTTVLYAFRSINTKRATDSELNNKITRIQQQLRVSS